MNADTLPSREAAKYKSGKSDVPKQKGSVLRKSISELIEERVAEMMLRGPHNGVAAAQPNGNGKLIEERLVWWEDGDESRAPEPGTFKLNRSQLNDQTSNAPSERIDFHTRLDVRMRIPILHPEDGVMWVKRPNATKPNLHIVRKRKRPSALEWWEFAYPSIPEMLSAVCGFRTKRTLQWH